MPSIPKSTVQEASVAAREKFKLSQSEIVANRHAKEGADQDEEQLQAKPIQKEQLPVTT